jgi:hypothetical protein
MSPKVVANWWDNLIRRFFLIANVYFAYVVFGVGALFLILPFAMLIYYAAKVCAKTKCT